MSQDKNFKILRTDRAFKGAVMQIKKALINDRLCVSKIF